MGSYHHIISLIMTTIRKYFILFYFICFNVKILEAFNVSTASQDTTEARGVIMCSPKSNIPDVMRFLWMLRYQWHSTLPVILYHCDEYSEMNIKHVMSEDSRVEVRDLCTNPVTYGMDPEQARKKLRGFFCKDAALVESPFKHTMLVDTDTIFFKSPEKLFDADLYKEHGAVFFRDRTAVGDPKIGRWIEWMDYMRGHGVDISVASATRMARENNGALFWLIASRQLSRTKTGGMPVEFHIIESSVVLYNTALHPKSLSFMKQEIANFTHGYGDKEFYWMSCLINQEPYAFSPYLAGMYGNCDGAAFHYDITKSLATTTPYFMNAENLIERVTAAGQGLTNSITKPFQFDVAFTESFLKQHGQCGIGSYVHCSCEEYNLKGQKKHRLADRLNSVIAMAQYINIRMRKKYANYYQSKNKIEIDHRFNDALLKLLRNTVKTDEKFLNLTSIIDPID